jgi:hypothetical protein
MTIDLFSRTASEKAMNQSNVTREFVRLPMAAVPASAGWVRFAEPSRVATIEPGRR